MTDLRKAAEMALEALEHFSKTSKEAYLYAFDDEIEALRTALAQPDNTSDSATRSADSAESFCKQELHNLMSVAGRMALELECLLLDTKDLSVVSKWWDTGMESLQSYRDYIWSITHGKDGEHFCDTHCVHTDHHPDCKIGKTDQEPENWWEDKEYVKYRFGENAKIVGVRVGLPKDSFKQPQTEQEPVAWVNAKPLATMHMDSRLNCVQWKMTLTCSKTHDEQIPLYTAPPKREWVGLTYEEILEIEEDSKDFDYLIPRLFARAIEAKLKEKNGY